LLANDQSALFHPLNMIANPLLSPLKATLLFTVASVLLASWWMYLFVRELGASRWGGVLAAVIFAYDGYMLAFQGRPQVSTAMWLPLMLLSTRRFFRKPSALAFLVMAAVVAGLRFDRLATPSGSRRAAWGLASAAARSCPTRPASPPG
jgi:hypothetical protein